VSDTAGGSDQVSFQWTVDPPTPPLLVVADPGDQVSTVGVGVSLQMTASGGSPPYGWSGLGLPAGLSIDAGTGLITGTPTTEGVGTVKLRVVVR